MKNNQSIDTKFQLERIRMGIFNILYRISRIVPGGGFMLRIIYSCDIPRHAKIAKSVSFQHRAYVDMTVDNSPLALATIAVKAVLTKTVKGEELGGGVTKVNASVITKDNVDEAEFWGNFDLEDGYWSETANIWNTYAIE